MKVKAKPGMRCPREENPTSFITDRAVEVQNTRFYRKRIAEGSLIDIEVEAAKAKAAKEKAEAAKAKTKPPDDPGEHIEIHPSKPRQKKGKT